MKKIIGLSLFFLMFVFSFTACDNRLLGDLIMGNYEVSESEVDTETDIAPNPSTTMNDLEKALVEEINKLRSDPEGWMIRHGLNVPEEDMWGDVPHSMQGRSPVPQLQASEGLNKAARHRFNINAQDPQHPGYLEMSDLTPYVDLVGNFNSFVISASCNSFVFQYQSDLHRKIGYWGDETSDAAAMVYMLIKSVIIPYFQSGRDTREWIMNPAYRYVGVSWGGAGIVLCFADSVTDK